MTLLGIDVGTTACKAVAFDLAGLPLAAASREYPLLTPAPGRAELDPDVVWDAVKATVRDVNAALSQPVTALAVAAQGEAVTPIGPDGVALANSQVSFDLRAAEQTARLEAAIGRERLAAITGHLPHPMHAIAKIMWLHDHDPALAARTWKFLCFGDLISWRLGAEPAIDVTMAARTQALDVASRRWSEEILNAAGVGMGALPHVVPSGTAIGRVEPRLARELGFAGQPLIVAGGHDQPCGAYGAGVVSPGEAMFAIGTTVCLAPVFAGRQAELPAAGYPCYPHLTPGQWITLAGSATGGSLLRWFRDTLGEPTVSRAAQSGRDVYDLLIEEAGDAPSPLLALPHFAGAGSPGNDPRSRGALIGLTFASTRAQIVRALLEGVMFEMALNREALAAAGVAVTAAVAVGGGARSDRWLSIAADILGIPLYRAPQMEAVCWGVARLAGQGAEMLDPSVPAAVPRDRVMVLPDPRRRGYYRDRLAVYRELSAALLPLHAAL